VFVRVALDAARTFWLSQGDASTAVSAEEVASVREEIEARLRLLARRAGLGGVPIAVVWAAVVLCGAAVAFGAWRWWPSGEESVVLSAAPVASTTQTAQAHSSGPAGARGKATSAASDETSGVARGGGKTVCVHVVGAVHRPGLYTLAAGSRVADAVDLAGGMTAAGAQEGINLARVVQDGEQVVIPTHDDVRHGVAPAAASSLSGAVSAGKAAGAGPGGIVNINTADAAALDTLPGVGPSTAAKIVADREANGPFASPDDLGRVPGIGPKKLAQLKPAISVN
jgi:competence protein ComEA